MRSTHIRLGAVVVAVLGALLAGVSASHAEEPTGFGNGDTRGAKNNNATAELIYRTISPCRSLDTRSTAGFPAAVNTVTPNCGVPTKAVAITANLTVTQTKNTGYLKLFPSNLADGPSSSINWFASGQTFANEVHIKLGPDGKFKIKSAGQTEYIVDVTGFYVQQMEALVDNAGLFSGSNRAVTAAHTGTGTYTVTWDTPVGEIGNTDSCAVTVSPVDGEASWFFGGSPNVTFVQLRDSAGALADGGFGIHVLC